MNISMHLAVAVAAAACLCVCAAAPENRLARTKQQRPTRGFKNVEMMTARGFGKRDRPHTRAEHQDSYDSHARRKFNPKSNLMVAYDFGKRSGNDDVTDEEEEIRVTRGTFRPNSNVLIARGYGKRAPLPKNDRAVYGLDNFWEMLEATPEREGQENDEKTLESIPLDWFVNEMLNNPDFARSVVRKFIDLNQDGMLSSEELLRNVV
ncbi:allatotropin isoform X5 [Spodoptera frugiperda]|uniref:Allatotropin isoform X5 n=1 Tax=Spodoptera frugiperda TaxID=7108 RepID=A0A9R0D9H5_SPOFR|nr:allatotropin isoform X5 [Spodoptera frugiperda]